MTDKLPPNLLALFAPRPPLRWVEPTDHAPEKRRTRAIAGVAQYLGELQKYKETDYFTPTESWLEARDRKKEEKKAALKQLIEDPKNFNPAKNPNIRGNALATLIVSRLSYDASEQEVEDFFRGCGRIQRVCVPRGPSEHCSEGSLTSDQVVVVRDTHAHEKPNKKKKPHRGYAFVEFENESDMQVAVKTRDGARLMGRPIKLDVERGRTVPGWKPRRLGGGLGGRGYTKAMLSRPVGPRFGDGFRGGYRGFDGGRPRGGGRGGRGGGFRGDFGGPRDRNSFGPPSGAPSGPGFDRHHGDRSFSGPGYDSRGPGSFDDSHGGYRDGGRFGDRDGGRRTGSNMEPIGRRDGGYRDRDRDRTRDRDRDRERSRDRGRDRRDYDRPRDDDHRKRGYDGGGYDDSRKMPRY